MSDGGGDVGGEDVAVDEADVEDHGDGGYDIEKEEEGEEVATHHKAAHHDFYDEHSHDGQSDDIEVNIRFGFEDCRAEIVEEE